MRQLATSDFVSITDFGSGPTEVTLDDFIASFEQTPLGFKFVAGTVEQNGPSVIMEIIFVGVPEFYVLPHPYTTVATFTVTDGRVARLEMVLSEQTRQDIASLTGSQPEPQPQPEMQPEAQPGMPSTSVANDTWIGLAAIASLAGVAAGALIRRRSASR